VRRRKGKRAARCALLLGGAALERGGFRREEENGHDPDGADVEEMRRTVRGLALTGATTPLSLFLFPL
jgi:hypothetical protein